MLFNRTIDNIGRIRKLIEVLVKYGFEDIVVNTGLKKIFLPRKKEQRKLFGRRSVFRTFKVGKDTADYGRIGPDIYKTGPNAKQQA
jgi:ubiquinone biosynthesis protein